MEMFLQKLKKKIHGKKVTHKPQQCCSYWVSSVIVMFVTNSVTIVKYLSQDFSMQYYVHKMNGATSEMSLCLLVILRD